LSPEELAALLAPLTQAIAGLKADVIALKAPPPPPAPPPAPPPPPAPAPAPIVTTPEQNAEALATKRAMEAMQAQVATLTQQNKDATERALQATRETAINTVLGDYAFTTPGAKQDAYQLLNASVKVTDTGAFIAGDNLPLVDFTKDFLTVQKSYLLAPANAGGSGAQGGSRSGISQGSSATMEMIKPNMAAAEKTAVMAAIRAALPQ
jgi:type IV secretory pathway VirB10-like protein